MGVNLMTNAGSDRAFLQTQAFYECVDCGRCAANLFVPFSLRLSIMEKAATFLSHTVSSR